MILWLVEYKHFVIMRTLRIQINVLFLYTNYGKLFTNAFNIPIQQIHELYYFQRNNCQQHKSMDFVFDYFLVVKRSTTERKVTDQFIARRKGIIKTQIDFKSVITSRNPKYPHSIQAVMYLDYELQFNKIHTYFGIYLQIVLANFKLHLYNFINSHATFYFFLIVQKINQSVIIEISHTLTIQQKHI